jgi:hypothetical protein
MSHLDEALSRYASIVDDVFSEYHGPSIGFLGDPLFEAVRAWTCDSLDGHISTDHFTEIASEKIRNIEPILLRIENPYSLFAPLARKLKLTAPVANQRGITLFIGSWGMSACELGWVIRHINRRDIFDSYLAASRTLESDIDTYNYVFEQELRNENGA